MRNGVNYLVSYVFHPSDDLSSVASRFGVQTQAITNVNGNNIQPFDTIFVPVNRLPVLSQPAVAPAASPGNTDRKGVITGLGVGLGIVGVLLILLFAVLVQREVLAKRRDRKWDEEKQRLQFNRPGNMGMGMKGIEANLIADVSDCLDKYKVFKIEDLNEATDFFSDSCLIQGSVYKGSIDGDTYAIKKMKWNACEELKILQMVPFLDLLKLFFSCYFH